MFKDQDKCRTRITELTEKEIITADINHLRDDGWAAAEISQTCLPDRNS